MVRVRYIEPRLQGITEALLRSFAAAPTNSNDRAFEQMLVELDRPKAR